MQIQYQIWYPSFPLDNFFPISRLIFGLKLHDRLFTRNTLFALLLENLVHRLAANDFLNLFKDLGAAIRKCQKRLYHLKRKDARTNQQKAHVGYLASRSRSANQSDRSP